MDGFSTWVIRLLICTAISIAPGYSSEPSTGSDRPACSCYTFHGGGSHTWSDSRQRCKTQGGDLVSMETVQEWGFINTQIQNKTTNQASWNEWWIGLVKIDGEWTWLTNHSLTYDKWQPHEPGTQGEVEECALIAKNHPENTSGLLNNAGCNVWRGWICEYENKVSTTNSPTNKPSNLDTTQRTVYEESSNWLRKNMVAIILVCIIVILIIVIVVVIAILRRVKRKAQEKREKATNDKNLYMTVEDAIELKNKAEDTVDKNTKNISKERTYATLGEVTGSPRVNEKVYASLDEATRARQEAVNTKAPTSIYESLNNLNTCTGNQYENLDNVKKEAK